MFLSCNCNQKLGGSLNLPDNLFTGGWRSGPLNTLVNDKGETFGSPFLSPDMPSMIPSEFQRWMEPIPEFRPVSVSRGNSAPKIDPVLIGGGAILALLALGIAFSGK